MSVGGTASPGGFDAAALPRPAVTVDIAVFSVQGDRLCVLLIERRHPPFAGQLALPGGFIHADEGLEQAARRELEEETGLRVAKLEQFRTYGAPGRDPRGRTISVVHLAELDGPPPSVRGSDDAARAAFFDAERAPPLAFDHDVILREALTWADRVR